ncbi:MAG: 16S rRNA (cytidine1402-2'-O)-methyltransferase [Bacteroidia bacterium]|jgi:16S rRNA (cytidine1402-2'-O)-methyltransferase
MSAPGKLYLIPNFLGNSNVDLLPRFNIQCIHGLREFVIENEKPARAFLKAIQTPISQDDFIFHFLNKHTDPMEVPGFLRACMRGENIGLLSDAGLPCVADPGYQVVKIALQKGIDVVPLSGQSSIMQALMASGFTGQNFQFHGYLPHNKERKSKMIRTLVSNINKGQTQIFIETPYRNASVIADLKGALASNIELCVVVDISLDTEQIIRKKLADWGVQEDFLHKRPAVFVLGL